MFLFSVACGQPAVTSAPVEHGGGPKQTFASAPEAKPACKLDAFFPFITADEQKAKVDAFAAQNGGQWKIEPANDMDGVFGHIRRAARLDYPKEIPGAPTDVEQVGRAFFEKNAAFLGFVPADIKRANFRSDGGGGNLAFDGPIPGLEGYVPGPFRVINVSYSVSHGYVMGFYSLSSIEPLELSLCDHPPGAPILNQVLGRDLFYVPHVYVQTEPPKPMGKVDLDSIKERTPAVVTRLTDKGKEYIVGWRLVVARGGYDWQFIVAASDGALLSASN